MKTIAAVRSVNGNARCTSLRAAANSDGFHFCGWPPSSSFWHSSRNVWLPTLLDIRWESGPEMSGDRSRERRRRAAERLIFAKQMNNWRMRASVLGMTQRWLDLAQSPEPVALDKALRLRAIQTNIGRELRAQFDLPREMPHRILTLLIEIGAAQDREGAKHDRSSL